MRPKRRSLSAAERRNLARGLMRRWRPGDTLETVSGRLDQSPAKVAQALEAPLQRVAAELCPGATADEIAARLGLPRHFVVYAFARHISSARAGAARKPAGAT